MKEHFNYKAKARELHQLRIALEMERYGNSHIRFSNMENWTGVKMQKPSVGRHVVVWGKPEHYDGENSWTKAYLGDDGRWYEVYSLETWTVYSWMVPTGPGF